MSEQDRDLNSFQEHLERIFKDLEEGTFVTQSEIADLRYACGLPTKKNAVLVDLFNNVFPEFPTIRNLK